MVNPGRLYRRRYRSCGLLVCFLAFASNAVAASDWIRIQSPHFTIVGNADELQLTRVATGLEKFLPALAEQVPEVRRQPVESIIAVIFKDDASYESFKILRDGVPANGPGYFVAGRDLDFITAAASGNETQRIVYHELFHALYRTEDGGPLPSWANEGLADFFSTYEKTFGAAIPSYLGMLRAGSWIPFRELLAATQTSPYYTQSMLKGMFYAESWVLIHYLLGENGGEMRPQLFQYLNLVAGGKTIDESAQIAFGKNLDALDSEVHHYAANWSNDKTLNTAPSYSPVIAGSLEVLPLSDSEAATYLGNLLMHLDRPDAAERQIQPALSTEPLFPGALTLLGIVRLRQNRNVEALQLLARAVEKDSDNPIAHFQYAAALQTASLNETGDQRRKRLELSRIHLRQAIELAPWLLDAYQWLAYVSIALEDGYDEAESVMRSVIVRYPERKDLRNTLGELMSAEAAHLELETLRRDKQSQDHRAAVLAMLRAKPRPVVIQLQEQASDGFVAKTGSPPPVVHPMFDGLLTMIDCRDGITLVLRKDDRIVRFHTQTPLHLEFSSRTSNAANEAACGPVNPEHHVIVTYVRGKNAVYLGEPIRIEYR